MASREWVVRTVLYADQASDGVRKLIEQLRYAQLANLHRDDAEGVCFDLICPKGMESHAWAGMNASRMKSMGYNAVVAPRASELVRVTSGKLQGVLASVISRSNRTAAVGVKLLEDSAPYKAGEEVTVSASEIVEA